MGFPGAADIRFSDDFQQRHTATVKIYAALAAAQCVGIPRRIFFHVRAGYADAPETAVHLYSEGAIITQGQIILADLIVFRQIRVKIVFSVHFRPA
ncbi:MAG: hypothetical protein BWY09_01843 [Candidatus Hydrogenedentes bacterium ADurb.Bin179]|nr:MAG: hypothetical protein BWY09_01843 [Candidatus Hydrogenedentes bacterium ADurb.Bin179]